MKYRKKPVVVEATQFHGERTKELEVVQYNAGDDYYFVITIHGQSATVIEGDWIIMEPDGIHAYPCKPDIFEATYEAVN